MKNIDLVSDIIYDLFRTLEARDKNATACYGVTKLQGFVLMELLKRGDLSMQELSDKMRLSMSTMTRVLDKLVNSDLVERKMSKKDRRLVLCALTSKGKEISKQLKECFENFFEEILSGFSQNEQNIFIKVARTIFERINEKANLC